LANEVELKFDVENGGARAIRRSALLADQPSQRQHYDTLYYDSEDGALRKAGYTLRIRGSADRHVQTIKCKTGSSAGLFVRQEWESEVPGFVVDLDMLKATPLGPHLETSEAGTLLAINSSAIDRTSWVIEHQGSRIEVALDEGRIAAAERETAVCEVELELKFGKADALFALAEKLGRVTPLRLGVLSKSERGEMLARDRIGRAAKADSTDLPIPISQAEAFHAIAHACLRHFRLNEMVLLEQDDVEALHQARVSLRRLRSALPLFRDIVHGAEYKVLKEELRWFSQCFGDARNLDVLIARLEASDSLDETMRKPLRQARSRAYRQVTEALRSERARNLMMRLVLWIETGSWRSRKAAQEDLSILAQFQLDRQWRRISRRADELAGLEPEELHRLRIRIKKLRYASEFLASLYDDKPRSKQRDRFIAALKELQECLGDLNDAWTAEELVKRLPAKLRTVIKDIHGAPAQERTMQAVEKAFDHACAAAGYWEIG
jgi:inorganic triphosphatase YgiF